MIHVYYLKTMKILRFSDKTFLNFIFISMIGLPFFLQGNLKRFSLDDNFFNHFNIYVQLLEIFQVKKKKLHCRLWEEEF